MSAWLERNISTYCDFKVMTGHYRTMDSDSAGPAGLLSSESPSGLGFQKQRRSQFRLFWRSSISSLILEFLWSVHPPGPSKSRGSPATQKVQRSCGSGNFKQLGRGALVCQLPWGFNGTSAILWVYASRRASGPTYWVLLSLLVRQPLLGLVVINQWPRHCLLGLDCIHGAILQHTKTQFCIALRISRMWMWENISCMVNEEQDRATSEIKETSLPLGQGTGKIFSTCGEK